MRILINREVKNKFQKLSYCDGQINFEINISCEETTNDALKPCRSIMQVSECYPHACYNSTTQFIVEVAVSDSLKQHFFDVFRQKLEKKRDVELSKYHKTYEEYYCFNEEYNIYQKMAEDLLEELGAKQTPLSFSYKNASELPFFNPNGTSYDEVFPPLTKPNHSNFTHNI